MTITTPINDVGDIDLYSVETFAQGPPVEQYAWLQQHDPVHRHAEPAGAGFWVVTRWADIRYVNVHEDLYSHAPVSMIEDSYETPNKSMVNVDPPLHTKVRGIAIPSFLPKAMRGRMSAFTRAADVIVEEIRPLGACDLVVDVAGKMAAYGAAEMLGIPRQDAIDLYRYVEIGLAGGGVYSMDERRAAVDAMMAYSFGVWQERRANPGDDVCSHLANELIDGAPMGVEDFCMNMVLLIVGAGDTSRHLIAGGVLALFQNPDQRALLMSDLDGRMPGAVEEMLRWVTPTLFNRRTAKVAHMLGGKQISAGDKVCVYYAAGNRDPEQFPDPLRFDITRSPNHHLSFSGFGQHYCLGAQVARAEAGSMVKALLGAFPDLRPNGEMTWERSNFVSGPEHLPVTWG